MAAFDQLSNREAWVIKARFASQQMTGAERCAHETVGNFDELIAARGNFGPIAARRHIVRIHRANIWRFPAETEITVAFAPLFSSPLH